MSINSLQFYDFDGLRFIPENSLLTRLSDGEAVSLRNKEKLLLLAFVKKANQTLAYEELREAVWEETNDIQMILRRLQVTKDTLQKKINTLRGENNNSEIIQSVPSQGYVFTLTVKQPAIESEEELETVTQLTIETSPATNIDNSVLKAEEPNLNTDEVKEFEENEPKDHLKSPVIIPESAYDQPRNTKKIKKSSLLKLVIGLLGLTFVSVAAVTYLSTNEEDKVRKVVKDSQMYESLVLYQNPTSFDENKLKEYWIVESHNSDLDSARIGKSARGLIEKGIRYGFESKCEQFDFVSVEVNERRDFAMVKTIEKWFVPRYRSEGTLLENKTVGPYAVTYSLRKLNGKWLIEKSSTARASGNS
ncbi:MAG TPA: helix-turn-helix domain-containing protein [Pyrinomonadaceae bacterium]